MCKKRVVILGAGLAGLSCALELVKFKKYRVILLERQDSSGGLARSIERNGFIFDIGPHRLHSREEWILKWGKKVLEDYNTRLIKRKRRSRIFIKDKFFDWPLNLRQALTTMPLNLAGRAVGDYLKAEIVKKLQGRREEVSYEDWVIRRFGRTIYEVFFREYNEKLWGLPSHQISTDWAIQRISLPNLKEVVLQSLFKGRSRARTNVASFFYPQRSGIGSLAQAIERGFVKQGGRVLHNFYIKKIKIMQDGKGVLWGRDRERQRVIHFDMIISSIPLTNLITYLGGTPLRVQRAAQSLKFRSLICVNLILNKERISNDHWIYFPAKGIPFNRFSEPKNFSLNNGKKGKTSLCVEITCDQGDKIWRTEERRLVQRTIEELERLNFIKQREVIDSFIIREPYAYPVYTLSYKDNLKLVKDYLKKKKIILIGRNGIFQYNNMDHSLEMGIKLARQIMRGRGVQEERLKDEYLG